MSTSDGARQTTFPGMMEEDDTDSAPADRSGPLGEPVAENIAPPRSAAVQTSPPAGHTVYAVDAHSLIFQVFHALPEMTSPRGEPVSAVYGFTRDILYLLEQKRPEYVLCAFDLPGDTFRHELFPDYKAGRGEMPEELVSQIPLIRRLLGAMGIPILDYPHHEADDVLATIARRCNEQDINCYLVTGDKDCRQLIGERVKVYNIRKDQVYGERQLADDWHIRPEQVVDFQALVGDSVDNVPGVPLIGPKIAGELLARHGTLEGVLAAAAEMKQGKRRRNLLDFREQALLSRRLARLVDDLPIEIDWSTAHVGQFRHQEIQSLFAELGFRGFGQQLTTLDAGHAPKQWDERYQTINTPSGLDQLVERLKQQPLISLDTETTSLAARQAEIVGYAFACDEGEAFYVPVRGPAGATVLDPQRTLEALRPILEDPAIKKIGQNLKYDMVVVRSAGVEMAGVDYDTMVASYLLSAGERNHGLDELSKRYLNHTPIKITELIGTGKNQRRMDEVPLEQIGSYAAEDADIPLRLRPLLSRKLEEANLVELFETVEMPLVEVLAEMEFNGIRLDVDRLAELSNKYGERMDALRQQIYQIAGREFNIASPKQLAQVLFTEQKLPVTKKTKTGPSTDASVLEELARDHPLPARIIEYRQYAKLKGTYVDALPALVNPATGRVHTSFNQVVAATGRLSSNEPNLQNIPIRTDTGREIRSAFLAADIGWKLLAADYSQIELRVLAHFSGDAALRAAFAADEDIHARVAAEVYGVSRADVTPAMRRAAKAVNFGVIYGQSPFGLSRALGIEKEEAAQFIESYFARYPGVVEFLQKTLVEGRQNGYVSTILGRRRAITGIRDQQQVAAGTSKNLPERTAVNTVIQGSAADLIKLAMVHVYRRMRREQLAARMLLQIHDELIFEVPTDQLKHLCELVVHEMTGAMQLSVPLKVDVKQGDHWADLEP